MLWNLASCLQFFVDYSISKLLAWFIYSLKCKTDYLLHPFLSLVKLKISYLSLVFNLLRNTKVLPDILLQKYFFVNKAPPFILLFQFRDFNAMLYMHIWCCQNVWICSKKCAVLDFFSLISTDGTDKSCSLIFFLGWIIWYLVCLVYKKWYLKLEGYHILSQYKGQNKHCSSKKRWGVYNFDVDVVTWKPIQMFQYQCKIPRKLA